MQCRIAHSKAAACTPSVRGGKQQQPDEMIHAATKCLACSRFFLYVRFCRVCVRFFFREFCSSHHSRTIFFKVIFTQNFFLRFSPPTAIYLYLFIFLIHICFVHISLHVFLYPFWLILTTIHYHLRGINDIHVMLAMLELLHF